MTVHVFDASGSHAGVIAMQAHRLRQLLWWLMSAWAMALCTSLPYGAYRSALLIVLALVCLGLAFRANRSGKLALATLAYEVWRSRRERGRAGPAATPPPQRPARRARWSGRTPR